MKNVRNVTSFSRERAEIIDGANIATSLTRGTAHRVPVHNIHRLSSSSGGTIAEISYGNFDERDIIRIEDDFGRHNTH